jgi:DNA-binding winged helix-turn-helix (wHTH) protein/tetratricopeptide (TPR) repeat protein
MATQPQHPIRLAFGPFEVDGPAAELRKNGHRVRLPDQPFQILLMLLERPGDLVSREQLRERIWSKGTFVDFEHSLSAAVHKIRLALSDSADKPRYIETVTGRGYRFIGNVETRAAPIPILLSVQTLADEIDNVKLVTANDSARRWNWKLLVTGGVGFGLILFAASYFYLHRSQELTDKDTIILGDFTNTTGDAVFDGTLRQGLEVQLRQSPYLSLVSGERIQKILRLMGQPVGIALTPELAREVCERNASAAVVDGSIASLGSQYVLGLRAKSCQRGEILDEEQAQAARKEDVLNALSQIVQRFRTKVGESLVTVEKHSVPLEEATTKSLDALKAYSTGSQVFLSSGDVAALPFFRRATEIDPGFASAYAALGRTYGDIGESDLSAQATRKAYELRDRADDLEKFFITATYNQQVTGDLEKAQRTMELWAQSYPRDATPHGLLSAFICPVLGQHEKALQESKNAFSLDPEHPFGYVIRSIEYQFLNRMSDADSELRQYPDNKLQIPDLLVQRYDLAFVKGDRAGMERQIVLGNGKTGAEDLLADHEAFVLAYSGRLQEARRTSQHAVDLAERAGNRERAAVFETGATLVEAFFENTLAAKQGALAGLKLSKGRDVEYGAALALALSGDSQAAQSIMNDLQLRFPDDTSVRFSFVPVLQAVLALNEAKPANAIEVLKVTVPYELSVPTSYYFGCFGALYPSYVRGEAYLAAHQSIAAAAEFQKIVDHRGIVASEAIGALAHLQLGRAFAMSAKNTDAKNAYDDFFRLWKTADSDIPILKQARTEYATLR